jgi:RHH-type transcriptional regulator, rel operon repressor / antitoxin RelB
MASTTLSIRVDETAKARLQALSEATGRSSSYLAAEAVEQYLKTQEWQVAAIKKGLEDAEAGRVVAHEDVMAWINSWDTDHELPMPQSNSQ